MRKRIFWSVLVFLACVAATALGQSEVKDFPVGTTTMTYEIRTEEVAAPQALTLIVIGTSDGRYTVRMTAEATGAPDEIGIFGFLFGMTEMTTGGSNVTFSPLSALIGHRDRLAAGEEYRLEGGASFTGTQAVTIASLPCLEGTYTNPKQPDVRITVAFSLASPVFISPLIREEELRSGQWVETFSLKLVQYAFTPAQG